MNQEFSNVPCAMMIMIGNEVYYRLEKEHDTIVQRKWKDDWKQEHNTVVKRKWKDDWKQEHNTIVQRKWKDDWKQGY
jgi:hypothetical protein